MGKRNLLFALVLFAFAFAAQAAEVITVKVVDPSGEALSGAKVALTREADSKFVQGQGGTSVTTTRDGMAEFGNLIAGWYTVSVRLPGYIPVRLTDIPVDYSIVPRRKIDVLVVTLNPIKRATN